MLGFLVACALFAGAARLDLVTRDPASTLTVVVTDQADTPMAGARVTLTGLDVPMHGTVDTDESGCARFPNLLPGTFIVAAARAGHVSRTFGDAGDGSGVPVTLRGDESFTARIQLPRSASLSGTVLDDRGRPLLATVRAERRLRNAWSGPHAFTKTTQSNPDGSYRFDDLEPGEYIVSARAAGSAWAADPSSERTRAVVFIPMYYQESPTAAHATRVIAPAGVTIPGIDFQLLPRVSAHVAGAVLDASGQPAAGAPVEISRLDDLTTIRLVTDSHGGFSAATIPGAHKVVTAGAAPIEFYAAAGDTTWLTIPAHGPSSVSGELRFGGNLRAPLLRAGTAVIQLRRRADAGAPVAVRLIEDGAPAFAANGVPSGEYEIEIAPSLDGWFLDSVEANGRRLTGAVMRLADEEDVTSLVVTLVPGAEVAGTVRQSTGAPDFEHRVLVFPADREAWVREPRSMAWSQPDTKGRFRVGGLPPGEYLLALVPRTSDLSPEPACFEALAVHAVRLTLAPGERVTRDVTLADRHRTTGIVVLPMASPAKS